MTDFRAKREEIVREHMRSEEAHDFEAAIRTFAHPRYEVVATGEEHDGEDAVRAFFVETHTAFPDFHFDNVRLRHAEDSVFVEVDFIGTHLGVWRGLFATGRAVRYRMCAVFEFDGDRLICERLYFDLITALRQLGIARDPTSLSGRLTTFFNHPLTVAGAALRSVFRSKPAG